MNFPIIAFQVFNLNDYDVKLFPTLEEYQLYVSYFNILEKYPDADQLDEGSSQRRDKILLESSIKTDTTLKSFPFTGLFMSELTLLRAKETKLSQYIALYNAEYNYILILYPDSKHTETKIVDYFNKLEVKTEAISSFGQFIQNKIDELDEKLFKESRGTLRLQKKINQAKPTQKVKHLNEHVKILSENDDLAETYIQLIHEFDDEFLHSEPEKFEFDSTTTQKVI